MENKRQSPRTPFKVRIRIEHPEHGVFVLNTQDISDSGVFVLTDDNGTLPISLGETVKGQVQGLPIEAPVVDMEVVRIVPSGIGLRFRRG